jgi:hypothetical protein
LHSRGRFIIIRGDMKKGCLIALAIVVLLIAGVAALGAWAYMHFTNGAGEATNNFLRQVGSGQIQDAYDSSSAVLRGQQTFAEFSTQIGAIGLKDFESASWPQRKIAPVNSQVQADLKGTVHTRGGDSLPAEATLLWEGSNWRVLAVQLPTHAEHAADASPAPTLPASEPATAAPKAAAALGGVPKTAPSPPSREDCKALAKKTLSGFADAIEAKDFTGFHQTVAHVWQEQITPAQMQQAFQSFIEKKVDLGAIQQSDPVLDQDPKVDERGVLALKGHCPTAPSQVLFELAYMMEGSAWKCVAVNVKVTEPTAGALTVPPDTELKKLVKGTLLDFNTAVRVQSFEAFHGTGSAALQQTESAAALRKSFQGFIDRKVDIGGIKNLDPVYQPPPAIDDRGVLRLAGYFPTKPQVKFKLSYVREGANWKLYSIAVQRE